MNRLEETLAEAFREFKKRVMNRTLEEIEKEVLEEEQGRVVKKGKRSRYLCTRFGWIRFPRQKVRYLGEGRYGFPLDEALGLRPHQQETDWVRKRGIELACDHPYRQAADLLAQEMGEVLSHRTLHRWVQEEGRKLRREEEAQRRRVFEEGDILPSGSCKEDGEGEEREIVVVEVDGTMLSSQERQRMGRGERFCVRILRMLSIRRRGEIRVVVHWEGVGEQRG